VKVMRIGDSDRVTSAFAIKQEESLMADGTLGSEEISSEATEETPDNTEE
jgi:hypothetical protein